MLSSPEGQLKSLLRQADSGEYFGEPVSQLQHALQAATLAENEGADETLILAALFHDIGHICDPHAPHMGDFGVRQHEHVGAEFLNRMGLLPEIAELVANHVNAKRYLTSRHPDYAAKLSPASVETLKQQGGPMSPEECEAFEALPRFRDILKLRAWDEAAKRPEMQTRSLDDFDAMVRRNSSKSLSAEQLHHWQSEGYLVIRDWFNAAEVTRLRSLIDDVEAWPETAGRWMQYFEEINGERRLCRVENFVPFEKTLAEIARGGATLNLLAQLFDSPAVLFKEKINFKLPGGAGFTQHQDAPAFTSFDQRYHITMMVSVDATTIENGCLEVAAGRHREGMLKTAADLTIDSSESLDWLPVPTKPGDLVLFDSFLPHRSGPNTTNKSRRALYLTYNHAEEGDVRDEYFELKRQSFPPDVERVPGQQYDAGVFNVGNPVSFEKAPVKE